VPRPKRTAGTTVDKRNGQRVSVVTTGQVEQFNAPAHVCAAARDAWDGFWDDRPALLLTPAAKVVLLRWVDALDRYLRTTAQADEQPLVEGSQGQMVVNPLYKVARDALTTVQDCEKQLGIGGLNAASLGLAAITEQRSLADMNARYGGGSTAPDDEDDDPRLRVVRAETADG
jgi:P27 family predicted phage terminase small subunit